MSCGIFAGSPASGGLQPPLASVWDRGSARVTMASILVSLSIPALGMYRVSSHVSAPGPNRTKGTKAIDGAHARGLRVHPHGLSEFDSQPWCGLRGSGTSRAGSSCGLTRRASRRGEADRLGSPRRAVEAPRPSRGQSASQVGSGPRERSRTPLLGRPLVNHGSRAHGIRWRRGGHRIDDLPDLR
jgi:hypothetical protein